MKILVVCRSASNPATRYRALPLVELARAEGHEVRVVTDSVFSSLARRWDLVFVQRRMFSAPLLALLRRRTGLLVFDFDDAIFLRSDGSESKTRTKRFADIARRSDLVLAGNAFLEEAAMHYCDAVKRMPTPVMAAKYAVQVPKDASPTLVWVGSQSTSRYLHIYTEVLERLGLAFPGLTLKVVSDFQFNLEHLTVQNIPWSEESEVRELVSAHIGIAPMVDNAWTRGKCALKVIQYMAAGLPVVSANIGANAEVIRDQETGFLVGDHPEDWVKAVGTLLEDPARAQVMGDAGRQRMVAEYSGETLLPRLKSWVLG